MSVLSDIVRNVLVIIIVTSFLELLLPNGAIKPFVRFAIGLFIIISVINQFSVLAGFDQELQINWWESRMPSTDDRKLPDEAKVLNEKVVKTATQDLQNKLEGQISAMALLVPGVNAVKTEAVVDKNGNVTKLDMEIALQKSASSKNTNDEEVGDSSNADNQEELINKTKQIISNLYGFKDVEMNIRIKEE